MTSEAAGGRSRSCSSRRHRRALGPSTAAVRAARQRQGLPAVALTLAVTVGRASRTIEGPRIAEAPSRCQSRASAVAGPAAATAGPKKSSGPVATSTLPASMGVRRHRRGGAGLDVASVHARNPVALSGGVRSLARWLPAGGTAESDWSELQPRRSEDRREATCHAIHYMSWRRYPMLHPHPELRLVGNHIQGSGFRLTPRCSRRERGRCRGRSRGPA